MEKKSKNFYHFYLTILIAFLIIGLTGLLGAGDFWGIKAAFGYGGGGGGGGGYYPPSNNTNTTPLNVATPTLDPIESPTESSFITLSGTRENETTIFINSSSDSISYPSETTWQALRFLDMGDTTFNLYAQNQSGDQSETISITINRMKSGDISGDGTVDDLDLASLTSHWGTNWPDGDLNDDGIIDDIDLAVLVSRWGT